MHLKIKHALILIVLWVRDWSSQDKFKPPIATLCMITVSSYLNRDIVIITTFIWSSTKLKVSSISWLIQYAKTGFKNEFENSHRPSLNGEFSNIFSIRDKFHHFFISFNICFARRSLFALSNPSNTWPMFITFLKLWQVDRWWIQQSVTSRMTSTLFWSIRLCSLKYTRIYYVVNLPWMVVLVFCCACNAQGGKVVNIRKEQQVCWTWMICISRNQA